MKNTYCTNCGAPSSDKICKYCGVQQNLVNRFCKYCGTPLYLNATICTGCKERIGGEPAVWNVFNILFSLLPLVMFVLCAKEKQPIAATASFFLSFLLCMPFIKTILKNLTIGKIGLRRLLKLARVVLFVGLFAVGMACIPDYEPETLTTQQAYEQMITYAREGDYQQAHDIGVNYPEVKEMEDGEDYLTYCDAMMAYKNGGLGNAYEMLLTVPHIEEASAYIEKLDKEIGKLDGVYKADNGVGSYLYLVIEQGKVLLEVVSYADDEPFFQYDFSDSHYSYIVLDHYSNGGEYYAIGRYADYKKAVTVDYVMNIFEDEIMLIVPEGAEFNTFNGLYKKIG